MQMNLACTICEEAMTWSMCMRFRPASASMVASTTSFSIFFSRVCTFPRKFTTLKVGLIANSCACRRRDAEPVLVVDVQRLKTSCWRMKMKWKGTQADKYYIIISSSIVFVFTDDGAVGQVCDRLVLLADEHVVRLLQVKG